MFDVNLFTNQVVQIKSTDVLIYTVRRDVLSDVFVQFIYLLVHFFYLPGLFRNLRGFF